MLSRTTPGKLVWGISLWLLMCGGAFAATCPDCGAGSYCNAQSCEICPTGYYCPGDGDRYVCSIRYPVGKGARSEAECVCGPDKVSYNDGKSCEECPDWTTASNNECVCNNGAEFNSQTGACTCPVGDWLDGNTCRPCNDEEFAQSAFYCPGDDIRHSCPAYPSGEWISQQYGGVWDRNGGRYVSLSDGQKNEITSCQIQIFMYNDDAKYLLTLSSDEDGVYSIPITPSVMYYEAAPGHYLADYYKTTAMPWYLAVRECTNAPANAIYTAAGTPDVGNCPWECTNGYVKNTAGDACYCPAGSYIDDSGACTLCEPGFFCPDGTRRGYCADVIKDGVPTYSDTPGATECTLCPTDLGEYAADVSEFWYWASEIAEERKYHTDVDHCRVSWRKTYEHGTFTVSCSHGPNGYFANTDWENRCVVHSMWCDAGYYVDFSNPLIVLTDDVKFWTNSYADMIQAAQCVPVGIGYYSPDWTYTRQACSNGYTTRTTTAASAGDCIALCDAGATRLKTDSGLSFNMYRDKLTTPALNIGLGNNAVCYVPLATGAGANAINITDGTTQYHTIY